MLEIAFTKGVMLYSLSDKYPCPEGTVLLINFLTAVTNIKLVQNVSVKHTKNLLASVGPPEYVKHTG